MKSNVCLKSFCLALAFFGLGNAKAASFQYDMRYHDSLLLANTVTPSGLYMSAILPNVPYDLGARAHLSDGGLARMDYQGEISYYPLSWAYASLRLTHNMLVSSKANFTNILGVVGFNTNDAYIVSVFGSFGMYARFFDVSGLTPMPSLFSPSTKDTHFAMTFGLRVSPLNRWWTQLSVGTYDEFEAFNLNNPFFFASISHQLEANLRVRAYARYKILLGFGRLDELMFGVGASMSI